MMKKKLSIVALCLCLLLTTSCGNNNPPPPANTDDEPAQQTQPAETTSASLVTLPGATTTITAASAGQNTWTGPQVSDPVNLKKYDGIVSRFKTNLTSHKIKVVEQDTTQSTPIVSMGTDGSETTPIYAEGEAIYESYSAETIAPELISSAVELATDSLIRLTEFTPKEKSNGTAYASAFDMWYATIVPQAKAITNCSDAELCAGLAKYILKTHEWIPGSYRIVLNALANGNQVSKTTQSGVYKQLVPYTYVISSTENEDGAKHAYKFLFDLQYSLPTNEALVSAGSIDGWHIYTNFTPSKLNSMLNIKQSDWGTSPITISKFTFGIDVAIMPYVKYTILNVKPQLEYIDTYRGFFETDKKNGFVTGLYQQGSVDMACIYKSFTYLAYKMTKTDHSHLYKFLEDNINGIYSFMKTLDNGTYEGTLVNIPDSTNSEYTQIISSLGSSGSIWYTFITQLKSAMESDAKYAGAWNEFCSLIPADKPFSEVVGWFDIEPLTNIGMYPIFFSNGVKATFMRPMMNTERFSWAIQFNIENEITEQEMKDLLDTYIALIGVATDFDYARCLDIAASGIVSSYSVSGYTIGIDYIDTGAILTIAKG